MSANPQEIEIARLRLDEARLAFEKRQALFRLVAVVGACATFAWTAFTYLDSRNREFESRRLEASKSYLERQLRLFEEATTHTARIAVAGNTDDSVKDRQRFWELYWGSMALVEGGKVEGAMKRFGEILSGSAPGSLKDASLDLAHCCREELARSWNTDAWRRR